MEGFLVWYDATSGELTTLDGRETAPFAATERLFQDDTGEPIKFWDAVIGGRSVGVPGMPALIEVAHLKMGKTSMEGFVQTSSFSCRPGFCCVASIIWFACY